MGYENHNYHRNSKTDLVCVDCGFSAENMDANRVDCPGKWLTGIPFIEPDLDTKKAISDFFNPPPPPEV